MSFHELLILSEVGLAIHRLVGILYLKLCMIGSMPRPPAVSHEILSVALAALEAQKKTLEQHILQVQSLLGTVPKRRGRPPKVASATASAAATPAPKKRRKMSAAARKRIGDATRKRWAAIKAARPKPKGPAMVAHHKKISKTMKKYWATKKAAAPTA